MRCAERSHKIDSPEADNYTSIQNCQQIQEKERRDKMEKQKARDELEAKREAEKIFSEKQQLKDQQSREERRKLQAFNVTQMVMLELVLSHRYKHLFSGKLGMNLSFILQT